MSIAPDAALTRQWMPRMGLEGDVAVTTGDWLALAGLTNVPAVVLLDAEGRIVGISDGQHSEDFFVRQADALLASGGGASR